MFKLNCGPGGNGHKENCECCYCGRLCVGGLAMAAGIVNGLGALILGWLAGAYNFGVPIVHLMGTIYKGYAPGFEGALWGGLWGFIEAFIAALIFGWLYNGIVRCCKCCCGSFCKMKGKSEKHEKTKH